MLLAHLGERWAAEHAASQEAMDSNLLVHKMGGSFMSESTQYLYKIQPTRLEMLTQGPTPEEATIVAQHFAYLKDLAEQGVVVLAGRTLNTDESTFGIVIFNANSEESARDIMNSDPAVKKGVMRAELYPYRIAVMTKM
jgi:uncharacterized protein YciI